MPVRWDRGRRELDGASGLVNLAGRSVDCIKTPDHQDEILRSRVEATRVLGMAVRAIDSPPPVWVQMSTAHIYGDPPEVTCTEASPFGYGLAPFVGRAWEDEFRASVLPSQRQVILRTSFVLGRDRGAGNGALARLGMLARLGFGGRIGSGRQGMSWIHEADLNRLFERALTDAVDARCVHRVVRRIRSRRSNSCASCAGRLACRSACRRLSGWFDSERDGCCGPTQNWHFMGAMLFRSGCKEERFEFQFPQLRDALNDLLTKPADQGQELQFGGETGTMESGSHAAQNYLGTRSHAKSNVD